MAKLPVILPQAGETCSQFAENLCELRPQSFFVSVFTAKCYSNLRATECMYFRINSENAFFAARKTKTAKKLQQNCFGL